MNPYLVGACVLGAMDDSQTSALVIVKQRPLSAADAQRALAECGKCASSDLAEQCENIAASIEVRAIDPLPDTAADILTALVERVCSGSVLGARTKQTSLVRRDSDDLSLDGCDDVLGMYDIASAQQQMNALKQASVRAAQALLKGGQTAINNAISTADEKGLPGPTERKNVRAHLQWHANALSKLSSTPNAMYGSTDDLKKYVMEAFVDANAVEEGASYIDAAWDLMWSEIGDAIAALPAEARKAAGAVVENVTGIPPWGWGAMIVGLVGIVGYGAYKILAGPAGGAVVKHYLRR